MIDVARGLRRGRVELRVRSRRGEAAAIAADPVVTATGCRIDVERPAFLAPAAAPDSFGPVRRSSRPLARRFAPDTARQPDLPPLKPAPAAEQGRTTG